MDLRFADEDDTEDLHQTLENSVLGNYNGLSFEDVCNFQLFSFTSVSGIFTRSRNQWTRKAVAG